MYTSAMLCLFLLTLITTVNCDLLQLKDGLINGSLAKSKSGRTFHQFYAIPYAEPPIGKLRFKVREKKNFIRSFFILQFNWQRSSKDFVFEIFVSDEPFKMYFFSHQSL